MDKNTVKAITMITQFGLNMLAPICLCSLLGSFIDGKLGTQYWVAILFFVGAIAGFRNIYVMVVKMSKISTTQHGDHRRKK